MMQTWHSDRQGAAPLNMNVSSHAEKGQRHCLTCQLAHDLYTRLPELSIRHKEDVRVCPGSGVQPVQAALDGLIKVRPSIEHLRS